MISPLGAAQPMKFVWLIFFLLLSADLLAQEKSAVKYAISRGGSAAYESPVSVIKELRLLEKYKLNGEVVSVSGSSKQIEALLDGRSHFSQTDSAAPVAAFLRGADLVLVAGALNKFPWSIATQSSIHEPADLIGKKIGIANFGGQQELSIWLILKEWNIPASAVHIVPSGDAVNRLVGLSTKALDAAVLAPPDTFTAAKMGLPILANLAEMKTALPLDVVATRRSLFEKNRDAVKRLLRAFVEAVHVAKTNRSKMIAVLQKQLREDDPIAAAGVYEYHAVQFSFPPRIDREGLRLAAQLIAEKIGPAKHLSEIDRLVDESILDEFEKEGFFKSLR
ncbi:MAG TPA: ABC transporter substrate-binding protein [Candidatus Binatia bacterium]|jgi:ABC-type nitrate/sulfonate/bicarbonate transport system substrate-binding protein